MKLQTDSEKSFGRWKQVLAPGRATDVCLSVSKGEEVCRKEREAILFQSIYCGDLAAQKIQSLATENPLSLRT
jgi:hypothetical protein